MNLLKNYLVVAVRYLLRQKTHSLINIVGLSTGFCFSLLIFLFVLHELSYDRFHQNGDNIYLVPMTWHFNGTEVPSGYNCSAGGPFLKDAFPQVHDYVRIIESSLTFRKENEVIKEQGIYFADSSFFKIFSFPFIVGNPATSLIEPNAVVLTERLAIKYFSQDWRSKEILNKSLIGPNNKLYKITGVIENIPSNSHLQFGMIVSLVSNPNTRRQPSWDNSEFMTYVLLNPHTDVAEILNAIPAQIEKKYSAGTRETVELHLVALKDIYLFNTQYKLSNSSDIVYVNIFAAIAILILVIATFNYINLSTARSMERALEVGIRKVLGAFRKQLFQQFMGESLVVTGVSLLLALCLAKLLLPFFNPLTGKTLSLEALTTWSNVLLIGGCSLCISLIAGIYPAVVLSRYEPVKVLKGKLKDSLAGVRLRKILVMTQFCISITLIICTFTISNQLNFIRKMDLGFNRDQILALTLDSLSRSRLEILKTGLSGLPSVVSVSAALQLPINISSVNAVSVADNEERRLIKVSSVDPDYIETVGLEMVNGSGFTKNGKSATDSTWEIILNQSALNFFGWSDSEAIGKELKVWQTIGRVKGVVRDFHFSSLHQPVQPLVLFAGRDAYAYLNFILIRTQSGRTDLSGAFEKVWKNVNPDSPFILTSLSDRYELLYQSESRLGTIITLFAFLAALISGLGLFGLASYSILQRTRELGIRKVLGASSAHILRLVSSTFVGQVMAAFFAAMVLSYFLMTTWLNNFAYKAEFSFALVLEAGLIAVLITFIAVAYHSLQVLKNNPVDTLRAE